MNAIPLMTVAMFLLCSACAISHKEPHVSAASGYVLAHSSSIPASAVFSGQSHEWRRSEVQVAAYGQVLSYWAGQVRTGR